MINKVRGLNMRSLNMRSFGVAAVCAAGLTLAVPAGSAPIESATYDLAAKAYANEDFAVARDLAYRAAKDGDADAQTMYAFMLATGKGGEVDETAAAGWYGMATRQGNKDAYYGLAMMAQEELGGVERQHMLGYLREAALAGHGEAARQLAEYYYYGQEGLPKDPEKMLYWLMTAAYHLDPQSAYAAGVFFAEGIEAGIQANPEMAGRYLKHAAELGVVDAMVDYGLFLYQGRYGEPNRGQAALWFEKAAKAGDVGAMFMIAYVLSKAEGVEQDLELAYKWLVKADSTGSEVDQASRDKLMAALEKFIPPPRRAELTGEIYGASGVPVKGSKSDASPAGPPAGLEKEAPEARPLAPTPQEG